MRRGQKLRGGIKEADALRMRNAPDVRPVVVEGDHVRAAAMKETQVLIIRSSSPCARSKTC